MSLGNLGKKLQRDLKANPKKGLLLLLMLGGAGYFWGPILKRWVGGKAKPGAVAAAPVILDDPKPVETAGKFKPPSWEKLQEVLLQDDLTKSAALTETFRDPFEITALLDKTPNETSSEPETPQATPRSNPLVKAAPVDGEATELDLKVTSVVFGPRGRMASIAGKVVWEGDTFEMKSDTASAETVKLLVRRVETWGVLLEHDGREYKALMPTGKLKFNDRVAPEAVANP